jgi:hypothetical protein
LIREEIIGHRMRTGLGPDDQWLEENSSAMLARRLMEQRERPSASTANDSSSSNVPISLRRLAA